MKIQLGVDTLCYHCRLANDEITLTEILAEVAGLGFDYVQLNAIHLDRYSDAEIEALVGAAAGAGLTFTLSGGMVGLASNGDSVDQGVDRVLTWLELARKLHSPYARVSSGFYRNELAGTPGLIKQEQEYVIQVASKAAESSAGDEDILLENHSDFTPDEYAEIIQTVGPDKLGVFLDVINPISVLADPAETVAKLLPWARSGHVKDYRMDSHYVEDRAHRRGFDVQWCYPGEGVADIASLIGQIASADRPETYFLAVEGLDNYPGVADQQERLRTSLTHLRPMIAA
jgi:sugar phosphate isomerase/epimerase